MIDQLVSTGVAVLIIGVVVLGVVEAATGARGRARKGFFGGGDRGRYCRGRFLTPNEKAFLSKLDRVVGGDYRVFAQVRLADLVDVEGCGDKRAHFEAMKPVFGKSVDFVICNGVTLDPVMILEVDDRTHDAIDRRRRDALVNRVCEEAGLRLVRVKARFGYNEASLGKLLQANGL